VRYLEKAVFQLDYGQFKLVFEALHERRNLLRNAPHLVHALPIATPCYHLWEVPYYWAGMKAYDLVAGLSGLTMSRFCNAAESLAMFPTMAVVRGDDGASLKGTIVYQDGQFDDARLNVALACTAAHAGATVANYCRVTRLVKDDDGRVVGVRVQDVSGGGGGDGGGTAVGEEFEVRAKVVLNATGPFTDGVRRMSSGPDKKGIMTPAGGVHVTLPGYFAPHATGLIVPKTKDGRVVFMLPWLGAVIAGTTDAVAPITLRPRATVEEVDSILEELAPYLSVPATRADVTSAWAGIRPLAADPTADPTSTENILRDHIVVDEGDGMVTVTGGKWTTYRLMAEHAVDAAITAADRGRTGGGSYATTSGEARGTTALAAKATPCRTVAVAVVGSHGYSPDLSVRLAQSQPRSDGARTSSSISSDGGGEIGVMRHLARSYGDRAPVVAQLASSSALGALGNRLVPGHPVIAAEVVYAARHEYCQTTCDFIARRTRLAFLDVEAAEAALPAVTALLAEELGWGVGRAAQELTDAKQFLTTFRV